MAQDCSVVLEDSLMFVMSTMAERISPLVIGVVSYWSGMRPAHGCVTLPSPGTRAA